MSSRGKRKTIIQLGNAKSKLHRYGYRKKFQSKDKTDGAGVPALIGDYSDSEAEDEENGDHGVELQQHQTEAEGANVETSFAGQPFGENQVDGKSQDKDIDDELKTFLSEIEAIPLPTDNGTESDATANKTKESAKEVEEKASDVPVTSASDGVQEEEEPSVDVISSAGGGEQTSAISKNRYSMFVKGEVEFANSPKPEEAVDDKKQEEILDIPKEPMTNWQMVQDETTKYYYYWNISTNQVTWEIPVEYSQYLLLHKEYTEKLAKLTPQQRKIVDERKEQAASDTNAQTDGSQKKTDIPESAARQGSVSPKPESDHHRSHKHKKEKRGRPHRKKHKRRRHSDDDDSDRSDESGDDKTKKNDKTSHSSSKAPEIGPQLPPSSAKSKASSTTTSAQPSSALSIVPYLLDQDDSDDEYEEENQTRIDKKAGQQQSPPAIESSHTGKEEKPPLISTDAQLVGSDAVDIPLLKDSNEKAGRGSSGQHSEEDSPPPTPPILQDEDNSRGSNAEEETVKKSISPTPSDIQPSEEVPFVTKEDSSNVLEYDKSHNSEQDIKMADSGDSVVQKTTKTKAKKEVIDMFADDVHVPEATVNVPKHDEAVADIQDVAHRLHPAVSKKSNEERLDQAENSEKMSKKTSKLVSTNSNTNPMESSRKRRKSKESSSSSVLNIVGYGSDEEDEKEEADKKTARNTVEEKDTHTSPPSSPPPSKKKKKDKKKDGKRRRDEAKEYLPEIISSKLDKDIISKVSETLDKEISDIVIQTVSQTIPAAPGLDSGKTRTMASATDIKAEKKHTASSSSDPTAKLSLKKKSEPEATVDNKIIERKEEEKSAAGDVKDDMDFDDLDDIDRALEVALEKKLARKKVELAQVEEENGQETVEPMELKVSDVTESVPEIKSSECDQKTDVTLVSDNGFYAHTDAETKTEVTNIAELALNKLEFLDISCENLSRLQVLFIELQTRYSDWQAGGLTTNYFQTQLKVAENLLEQYELSAVPEGWCCQWDSSNNRYYYRNKITNKIQWEYPEVEGAKALSEATPSVSVAASEDEEEGEADGGGGETAAQEKSRRNHGKGRSSKRRRSSGSRHRKRDDKDRDKRDKHNSKYHRKRRRRREHSSSSGESSTASSRRHHHRHTSKRKRKHRSERSKSSSVEIVGEDVDHIQIDDDPVTTAGSPADSKPQSGQNGRSPSSMDTEPLHPAPVAVSDHNIGSDDKNVIEKSAEDGAVDGKDMDSGPEDDEGAAVKEEKELVVNPAVISKPPQIVVPPQVAAAATTNFLANSSDTYTTPPQLFAAPSDAVVAAAAAVAVSNSHTAAGDATKMHATATSSSQPPVSAATSANSDSTVEDSDKAGKKKKKEKKLATGSNLMMKKKHMTSMVQKWQKVKKEVEKEDRAKELRQAAIRKKIEELK